MLIDKALERIQRVEEQPGRLLHRNQPHQLKRTSISHTWSLFYSIR